MRLTASAPWLFTNDVMRASMNVFHKDTSGWKGVQHLPPNSGLMRPWQQSRRVYAHTSVRVKAWKGFPQPRV